MKTALKYQGRHFLAERATRLALLLLLLVSVTPSHAKKRAATFTPQGLETAQDGKWSGLECGRTTFKEIKEQFETGRSDFADATVLTQPKNAPLDIHLLWKKEQKSLVLNAILLRYLSRPELKDVQAGAGEAGQALYASDRLEDWHLRVFPTKGIAGFVLSPAPTNQDQVALMVIAPSRQFDGLKTRLRDQVTPIVERVDPNAGKPKLLEFGSTEVSVNFDGPYSMSDKEKKREEEALRLRTAKGAIRYRSGAAGSYRINVGGSWKQGKGGSLTVGCTVSGEGPYGAATGSGSSMKPLTGKVENLFTSEASLKYTLAFMEAQEQAERDIARVIEAQGPPPIESVRERSWLELIAGVRGNEADNPVNTSSPTFYMRKVSEFPAQDDAIFPIDQLSVTEARTALLSAFAKAGFSYSVRVPGIKKPDQRTQSYADGNLEGNTFSFTNNSSLYRVALDQFDPNIGIWAEPARLFSSNGVKETQIDGPTASYRVFVHTLGNAEIIQPTAKSKRRRYESLSKPTSFFSISFEAEADALWFARLLSKLITSSAEQAKTPSLP